MVLCTQREAGCQEMTRNFQLEAARKVQEVSIIFSPCCHSVTTIVSPPLHSMMLKSMNVMISGVGVNNHSVPLNAEVR